MPVNSKTPMSNNLGKGAYSMKQKYPKEQFKQEENLDAYDYRLSYKVKEQDEDDILNKEDIEKCFIIIAIIIKVHLHHHLIMHQLRLTLSSQNFLRLITEEMKISYMKALMMSNFQLLILAVTVFSIIWSCLEL